MVLRAHFLTTSAATLILVVLLLQLNACRSSAIPTHDAGSAMVDQEDEEDITHIQSAGSGDGESGNGSESQDHACRRVSRMVNFDEIGMNSIRYPKSVDIGECVGNCPLTNLYYRLASLLDNEQPCCVPMEFQSFLAITDHYSAENSRYEARLTLPNAIVKTCKYINMH